MSTTPQLVGQTISHYRVIEKIGEGGMGVVYRAHDERLDRDVAVKVLPAGTLADQSARNRFRKEALALSRLNHPNIATVYDFATEGNTDILVIELIPGLTLDEKVAAGPLPEKDVVQIGLQLADGLQAAHDNGTIHRDLKPGNLRLTPDGRLKILDFGLAKRLDSVTGDSLTESLSESLGTVGTLPYMAPEQLRGEKVDARADIWAAGAVLYELGTGRRPFRGKTASALADQIFHAPPPELAQLSPPLAEIIFKCLEKDPASRYQSAKELAVDLRRRAAPSGRSEHTRGLLPRQWWIAAVGSFLTFVAILAGSRFGVRQPSLHLAAPSGRIESLAVLPLDNLSGDPAQEYFADGMTEELTTELAQLSALRVISRTSVMQYKSTRKTVPQIARELNVDAVVEGSVERAGDRVRITAQLIYAPMDQHLWAKTYERNVRDVLVLQDEVSRAIANQVQAKLTPAEQSRLSTARQVNPEAYDLYLRGRYAWAKRGEENINQSLAYFSQAIALDPNYAAAYSGIAQSYGLLGNNGYRPADQVYPKAKAAALKALELDPDLSDAHTALALVRSDLDWDWDGAQREYRRAIALNPNDATAHHWYGMTLGWLGHSQEAFAEIERARQLDPLSTRINDNVGNVLYQARQYDRAITEADKTIKLDPIDPGPHLLLGLAYLQLRRYSEAITEIRTANRQGQSDTPFYTIWLAYAYAVTGNREQALRTLREIDKRERRTISPTIIAAVYAGLGQKEEAFVWLEKAMSQRDARLSLLKVHPAFDPLRSDPRFADLLRRRGFS